MMGKSKIPLILCAIACCCAVAVAVFGVSTGKIGGDAQGIGSGGGAQSQQEVSQGESQQQGDGGQNSDGQSAAQTTGSQDVPKLDDGATVWEPSNFGSQEEADYYEENWHTDYEQRGKYSFKEVTTSDGTQYAAGELSITMSNEAADEAVQAIAEQLGGSVARIRRSSVMGDLRAIITFSDEADINALAEQASTLPGVTHATPNYSARAMETSSTLSATLYDPESLNQTYLTTCRFKEAWKKSKCLESIEVAVIDSGIDNDHEDLVANIDIERSWDAYANSSPDFNMPDYCGHGTAVSGIISAEAFNGKGLTGCSYDAQLLPIRVFDVTGASTTETITDAFDYLFSLRNPPKIINMSLGSDRNDPELESRINRAITEFGMVIVASVGNDSDIDHTSDPIKYPAAYDGVIGVGAVNKDGTRCRFSNINSTVDICAIGSNVMTTVDPMSVFGPLNGELRYYASSYSGMTLGGGVKELSIAGTSFAAPQVSAAAALLLAGEPDLAPDQVAERLCGSAKDLGAAGRDPLYGCGLLDAAAALGVERPSSGAGSGGDATESKVPVGPVATGGYITGAATRGAAPAVEILGMAGVEESG